MLIDFNELKDKLNDVRTGKIKEGAKIGVNPVDDYFRFKEGNFNVILGHANVGKTTLMLYLMLVFAKRLKIRWLVFSSENEAHSIVRKLVEFLAQKPINKIDKEEYNEHLTFIYENFKIIDASTLYTYRQVIELATAIRKPWEYKGFLIDPYNSLIKNPALAKQIGGHEYNYQATTELRIFCKNIMFLFG